MWTGSFEAVVLPKCLELESKGLLFSCFGLDREASLRERRLEAVCLSSTRAL